MLGATESGLAARRIEAARTLVAAVGDMLLVAKGFSSVEELTAAQERKWRTEAKKDAVVELQAATGRGQEECRHLVALGCAPQKVRSLVISALDAGEATFEQVRAFWRRCARLAPEAAEAVAQSLFGTEPAVAAAERLTPDGGLSGEPWHAQPYRAALEREATAVEGVDVAAERARRRAAYAERRLRFEAHEDGTATITLTDGLIEMCGIRARIERAARLLRKGGDERTLDQLRAYCARVLLLHGTIPVPKTDDPDDLSDGDLEKFAQVMAGMPTVNMQVVIPWDALTGSPACQRCGGGLDVTGSGGDVSGAPSPSPPSPERSSPAVLGTGASCPWSGSERAAVGQVLGVPGVAGVFITPGQARELLLEPGTILTRLLTDPADGRLIERRIKSYRPDPDMRRQVVAADVLARVAWSTHPASGCELDHVTPWSSDGTGGPTSELNLASLPKTPHELKTQKKHASVINDRRDLTWTTLLAWDSPTRVHDYRQYLAQARHLFEDTAAGQAEAEEDISRANHEEIRDRYRDAAHAEASRTAREIADLEGTPRPGWARLRRPRDPDRPLTWPEPGSRIDLDDPEAVEALRQQAAAALYAALATRGPRACLEDLDDLPGATEHGGPTAGWWFVTRGDGAARRNGARADQPTAEEVLRMPHPDPEHCRCGGSSCADEECGTPGRSGRAAPRGEGLLAGQQDRGQQHQGQPGEASQDEGRDECPPPPF